MKNIFKKELSKKSGLYTSIFNNYGIKVSDIAVY